MKKLIKFYSPTCAPCKALWPHLELLKDYIEIEKVDVTQHPEIAEQYNVMGLPTVVLFEDNILVDKIRGFSNSIVGRINSFALGVIA